MSIFIFLQEKEDIKTQKMDAEIKSKIKAKISNMREALDAKKVRK